MRPMRWRCRIGASAQTIAPSWPGLKLWINNRASNALRLERLDEPMEIGSLIFETARKVLTVHGRTPNRGGEELRIVLKSDVHISEQRVDAEPFLQSRSMRHHVLAIKQIGKD